MRGIERDRRAALRPCPALGQHLAPRELADLAGELTDAVGRDRRLAIEPVAPHDVDRAPSMSQLGALRWPMANTTSPGPKSRSAPLAKRFAVSIWAALSTGKIARFCRLGWHRMSPSRVYVQSVCSMKN